MSQRDSFTYTSVSPPVSPKISPPISPFKADKNGLNKSQQDTQLSATAKRHKYLRKLLKFRQMDFEYAFWQMIYLFIAPQKVYRNFQYRKNTKNQWARDDPAFLVLLSFWLVVSSVGFAIVLGLNFLGFLKFIFWVVFVDCIGVGLVVATIFWFITNRYMMLAPPKGQDVEWGFCFDVHLNAFFPVLMILHLLQLAFVSIITRDWFFGRFFGNTLWLIALGYYVYITFLGYSVSTLKGGSGKIVNSVTISSSRYAEKVWLTSPFLETVSSPSFLALPFLKNTRVLLFPMMGLLLIYILSLILGWNFSKGLCDFYHFRVL